MGALITGAERIAFVPSLDVFGIEMVEATQNELRMFGYTDRFDFPARARQWIARALWPRAVVREDINSSPAMLSHLPPRVYVDGYWQAEGYFCDVAAELRNLFRPGTAMPKGMDWCIQRVSTPESVGVHVHRGGYVWNSDTAAFHGICSLDYYRDAIAMLRERIGAPRFFVFSDDRQWALGNLCKDPDVELVPSELSDGRWEWHQRLMSLCAHQIVANSSFSWWTAWLNPRPDKIVVAPDPWFAHPSAQWRGRNICPADWIRLARASVTSLKARRKLGDGKRWSHRECASGP